MHQPNQAPSPQPPVLNMANGALRFALELTALGAMGRWGWALCPTALRYLTMLAVPAFAATLWGTFTVPSDPSRGKNGPVPVSGIVRLVLEAAFFGFAAWALFALGHARIALAYAALVCTHYTLACDRVRWLLTRVG